MRCYLYPRLRAPPLETVTHHRIKCAEARVGSGEFIWMLSWEEESFSSMQVESSHGIRTTSAQY